MKREGEHVKREGERANVSGATRDALARRRTRRAVNDPAQRPCSVTVASSRWSRENVLGSLRLLLCMLRRYSVRSVRGKAIKPRAAKPGSFPNFSSPPRSGRVAQASFGFHAPPQQPTSATSYREMENDPLLTSSQGIGTVDASGVLWKSTRVGGFITSPTSAPSVTTQW